MRWDSEPLKRVIPPPLSLVDIPVLMSERRGPLAIILMLASAMENLFKRAPPSHILTMDYSWFIVSLMITPVHPIIDTASQGLLLAPRNFFLLLTHVLYLSVYLSY